MGQGRSEKGSLPDRWGRAAAGREASQLDRAGLQREGHSLTVRWGSEKGKHSGRAGKQ